MPTIRLAAAGLREELKVLQMVATEAADMAKKLDFKNELPIGDE